LLLVYAGDIVTFKLLDLVS